MKPFECRRLKDSTGSINFPFHIEADDLVIESHAYKSCDGIHVDEHMVSHGAIGMMCILTYMSLLQKQLT